MPEPIRPLTVRPLAADSPAPDAVVLGLTDSGIVDAPPYAPIEALERLVSSGEARSELGHTAHVHDADGVRWVLVGLYPDGPTGDESWRAAAGAAVATLRRLKAERAVIVIDDAIAAAVAEAVVLANHQPAKVQGPNATDTAPSTLVAVDLSGPEGRPLDAGAAARIADAVIVAEAQNEARRLQQLPANLLTPHALAVEAEALGAEIDGLAVTVEEGIDALEARGMGLFAAVAKGSVEPPALIVARYEPADARGPVLGLVGKAVTHDTGGYSLKPPLGMVTMKFDMSGGAAVLQAIAAIARLRLPVRVIAVIVATENTVNGAAMKPGDVFVAANGTTVEVTNTDAEGRLVLAEGLTYALELGAERLVDVATLTGGIVTALGTSHAGVMGRDQAWLDAVHAAGEQTGERTWMLPLEDDHRELMKSKTADLVNSGGRSAHPIQGAAFLERFTEDVPWAHVDIAALHADLPRKYLVKGPSGWGVRLLVQLARQSAA